MQTIEELVRAAPVFAGLQEGQLALIAGCARNARLAAGELLFGQGEPADRFFLIRHGRVALEVYAPGRPPIIVETLEDGEVVGWSWLFAPYRWQLDARAQLDCGLIEFDGACLRGKCDADHELGYQLMSRFAANVVDRLQATRVQLLDVYGHARARG
jgi:CRP/FNR family transcriptional regulator, cyclic AMP receptor protein